MLAEHLQTMLSGKPMQLDYLFVMQDDLRHWSCLPEMIEHLAAGGFWTTEYLAGWAEKHNVKVSPIIQITRFEDGEYFIHDGHHRCVAAWLAGRTCLWEPEYKVSNWTYDKYLEINPAANWYTPFDPRIHLRIADIGTFKTKAKAMFLKDPAQAEKWIQEHSHLYRREKGSCVWLMDLAQKMQRKLVQSEILV